MILVIDNYDSFTYNLVQYLGELGAEMRGRAQRRASTWTRSRASPPTHRDLAGSRQPRRGRHLARGHPTRSARPMPILGVCLGHQAIGQAFGGTVCARRLQMHGKTSQIHHDGRGVFARPPQAVRGHALPLAGGPARGRPGRPRDHRRAEDGEMMGLRHRRFPVEGVQFHPESILTVQGKALLANFSGPRRRPWSALSAGPKYRGRARPADHAELAARTSGRGGPGGDRRRHARCSSGARGRRCSPPPTSLIEDVHFRRALGRARRHRLEGPRGEPLRHRRHGGPAALGAGGAGGDARGTDAEAIDAFYAGMREAAARRTASAIVGGRHLGVPGGWMINVTLLGGAHGTARLRSTAAAGRRGGRHRHARAIGGRPRRCSSGQTAPARARRRARAPRS